jgi:hypothetical protein
MADNVSRRLGKPLPSPYVVPRVCPSKPGGADTADDQEVVAASLLAATPNEVQQLSEGSRQRTKD